MSESKIIAVAGLPGVGKTTWIRKALGETSQPSAYGCLGSGIPIDLTYLVSEFPQVEMLGEKEFNQQLSAFRSAGLDIYLEIAFPIDLSSLVLGVPVQRVAVLPPGVTESEWQDWAEIVVVGAESMAIAQSHLWRASLTGEILDPASLDILWYELTQGAYGEVQRAKGIFEVSDGRSFYFNFVAGLPEIEYTELNLPRWLKGRPTRFSGMEVVGRLDEEAIAQTLKECCLDEQAIAYYQQQIQQSLAQEEVRV